MPQFVAAEIKEDFLCCRCRSPWDPEEALACQACEGVQCRPCRDAKSTACPRCGVDPAVMVPPHRVVRSLAEALEVRCDHAGLGCKWTGPRSTFFAHDGSCPHKPAAFLYADEARIPADLICTVCHGPFVDPVQLRCEHVFCRACAIRALADKEECPVDRQLSTISDLREAPKVVRELVDELPVKCGYSAPHAAAPCNWIGPRKTVAEHRKVCTLGAGAMEIPTTAAAARGKVALSMMSEFPTFVAANTADEICVMAHIAAPAMQSISERKKPLALSAVIDLSGSMRGEKLRTVAAALEFVVAELTERDTFGIVTFADAASVAFPQRAMTATAKNEVLAAVRRLSASGSTNLSGGLFTGITQLKAADGAREKCRSVFLFTDGQANLGLTDAGAFAQPLRAALAGAEDMAVHTFGFGSDHNAVLLQALAEAAGGTYYYIKGVEVLKESFADCLGGLLSTVAQCVSLQFTTSASFTVVRTLTAFPVTTAGNVITVTLRDLYASESRDVLFMLRLAGPVAASPTQLPIATASISYESLLSGAREECTAALTMAASADKFTGAPRPDVAEQRARVLTVEALAAARVMADAGRVDDARAKLMLAKECVAAAPATDVTNQLCNDMLEVQGYMASPAVWQERGTKVAVQYSQGYQQQRLNRCVDEMTDGLAKMDNQIKMAFRKKAKQ